MSDSREPERDPAGAPYFRLPLPVVAVALVVFLAALLGLGIYANNNLRPQGIVVPTPAVQGAPTQTALPVAGATPAPANTPIPAPATTAPTPLILTVGTPPTEVLHAPTSAPTNTPSTVSGPNTETTPAPTLDPLLVAEVTMAFDQYWQVRTQALLDLDDSHLSEVMAGDHLQVISNRIDELRAENKSIQTNVDHDIHIVEVETDSAKIIDDYISDSVYVDPITKAKISEPTSDELRVLYVLQKIEGKWKVVDSVVQA